MTKGYPQWSCKSRGGEGYKVHSSYIIVLSIVKLFMNWHNFPLIHCLAEKQVYATVCETIASGNKKIKC